MYGGDPVMVLTMELHFCPWPSTDCCSMSFSIPFLSPCKYLPSGPAHDRSTANYHLWEEINSLVCSEPATSSFSVVLSYSCVRSDIDTSHPISLPQTAQHFSCLFPTPFGVSVPVSLCLPKVPHKNVISAWRIVLLSVVSSPASFVMLCSSVLSVLG